MKKYAFPSITSTIFEINTLPQLTYFHTHREDYHPPQILHTHQEIVEIIFIEKGTGHYTIGNHMYSIKENDILLINSGILHGTNSEFSGNIHTSVIGIRNLHLKGLSLGQIIAANISPIISTNSCNLTFRKFISLLEIFAVNAHHEVITEAANHLLESFLSLIFNLIESTAEPTGLEQDYNLGLRIKEYIDEHYLEDLNLASIADALHVNIYYMSHTFKKLLGYSPIQYVIQRRIGEAQNLLLTTDFTVTDIALRCGYNNSNYFQSVFNNLVGMPPGKYRKTWRS